MMRKITKVVSAALIAMSAISAVSVAQATASGMYIGWMLGQPNYHTQNQTVFVPVSTTLTPPSSGLGTRFYLGGNFNKYFGMEGGLAYYFSSTYKASNGFSSSVRTKAGSVDLLGKAMFPFAETGFDVFGKFGFASFLSHTGGRVNSVLIPSSKTTAIRPALGLGVSYDINQHWVADLSYTRIFIKSTYVSNPDFIALGISYHVLDAVCGQFLC